MGNGKSRLMAIKLSVSLGEKLLNPEYKISAGYIHGFTHAVLAQNLRRLPEFSQYDELRLTHAVRYALVGNDNKDFGPVYGGLVSDRTYKIHSKRHQVDSGKSNGRINVLEKRGFHGLNGDKLREFAVKSAIAKGMTPWTREELSRAFGFSLFEIFKREGHIAYDSIADHLNNQFYNGRKIRTGFAVKDALKRFQQSLERKVA